MSFLLILIFRMIICFACCLYFFHLYCTHLISVSNLLSYYLSCSFFKHRIYFLLGQIFHLAYRFLKIKHFCFLKIFFFSFLILKVCLNLSFLPRLVFLWLLDHVEVSLFTFFLLCYPLIFFIFIPLNFSFCHINLLGILMHF